MADLSLDDLLPEPGPGLCVHVGGVDHSAAEVRARAESIAGALADAGVGAGHGVGLLLGNTADHVAALFGVWRAGGVVIPLNPRLTDTELHRTIATVDPLAIVTTSTAPLRRRRFTTSIAPLRRRRFTTSTAPLRRRRFTTSIAPLRRRRFTTSTAPLRRRRFTTSIAPLRRRRFTTSIAPLRRRRFTTSTAPLRRRRFTTEIHALRTAGRTALVLASDRVDVVAGTGGVSTRHDAGVALVSFTSGTTGAPKPVPLLHARVMEGLDQVLATLRAKPGGGPPMPNLVPVPLSVWAGIYQVLFAFRVGAPVVLMDGFDTLAFTDVVARFGIRSTVLPPAAMVMLADDERIASLEPLRYVRSISSPLSPLQARRFRDRFGIRVLNGYGQTELGGEVVGWSAADSKEHGDTKLGSVGRPHAGVEVRTDDDSGELFVRIPGRIDDWQRTGDVASIDQDGFVWIEGRISDMVNRGGLKVHPGEVEEVLRLSPAVSDVAVVGAPDDRLGEVPVAYVVESAPVTDAELEALCREHLAPYKVPARFVRIAELPRNDVGKVVKRDLGP